MSNSVAKIVFCCLLAVLSFRNVAPQSRHNSYASILQDTRNEPTPDGNFGYLYQTEDGIVSSARGDPSGKIRGTFSYTDPTGLRVNINYNAGSRFDHRQMTQAGPTAQGYYNNAQGSKVQSIEDDGQYRPSDEGQYTPTQGAFKDPSILKHINSEHYVPPQYVPRSRPYLNSRHQSFAPTPIRSLPRQNQVY